MSKKVVEISAELKPLIPKFLKKRQEDISILETAIQKENFEDIQDKAHSIRGAAASYGFMEMSNAATIMEKYSEKKQMAEIKEAFQTYKELVKNTEVKFKEVG